jgi:UDP-glucose 4-epimerase
MSNFIVTGAAGFIGGALSARLIQEGHTVVTIDNLSTGYEDNIPEGVEFIYGDCGSKESIKKIPERNYEAIFHIAGQSSGEISFDNPVYDITTNTVSTLLLLDYALQHDCDRFIYAGTMSVYGEQPDKPITEDAKSLPTSFYGVGKLASEHYMDIYQSYGIKTTSLRLFNVYGPGQNLKNLRQGMVSIFLAQIFNDGFVEMKGSPDRYRDFIYIDDVVKAFTNCLIYTESQNEVINIATGNKTNVGDLINLLFELSEKPRDLRIAGSTSGDLHGIFAETEKMRKSLHIKETIPLELGLKKMIDWMRSK